jgi:hypothetical protein
MKRLTKFAWVFFALFAVLSLLGASLVKLSAQNVQQQERKKPELPTLDYETEVTKAVGEDRKKRSARFNSHFRKPHPLYEHIVELPNGVVPLPTINHWWQGMSALPVAESDVIIAGKVVDAKAHLSDDRTEIYSEFLVEVGNIFKNTGDTIGRAISGTRRGGAVRFASGKVQEYRIAYLGVPMKDKSYVLFLKREEAGDFTILTGYELSNGLVTPLDGEEGSTFQFNHYDGAVEAQFMQDLKSAIQSGGDK